MATLNLTGPVVSAARAKQGERLELWDTKVRGLCLRVSSASKVWVLRYRTPDGRQPRLTLGDYSSAFGLSEARAKAAKIKVAVEDGADPASEKRQEKAEAQAQPIKTLDHLASAYFTACQLGEWKPRKKRKRATTLAEERRQWARHVSPALGKSRPEDVSVSAIKSVLRALVAAGHGVTANRVRSLLRQVFNFAIAEGRMEANPIAKVAAIGEETARARVLSDDELRTLWGALQGAAPLVKADGEPVYIGRPVRIALMLSALLLQRRSEVARIQLSHLDLQQRAWLIPGHLTKNGREHLVPLGPRAVELIEEAIALADAARTDGAKANDSPLFPSPRDPSKAITPAALSHAMRDLREAISLEGVTPHDLRRTGASSMASERLGVTPFVIGRVLNHITELGGAAAVTLRVYALHDFAPEKRAALLAWEGLLLEIIGERKRPANVAPIRGLA